MNRERFRNASLFAALAMLLAVGGPAAGFQSSGTQNSGQGTYPPPPPPSGGINDYSYSSTGSGGTRGVYSKSPATIPNLDLIVRFLRAVAPEEPRLKALHRTATRLLRGRIDSDSVTALLARPDFFERVTGPDGGYPLDPIVETAVTYLRALKNHVAVNRFLFGYADSRLGLTIPEWSAQRRKLLLIEPPRNLFGVAADLQAGPNTTLTAPELTYANDPSGLDLSFRASLTGLRGYGFGAKEDLSASRRPVQRALATLRRLVRVEEPENPTEHAARILYIIREKLRPAYNRSVVATRYGPNAAYHAYTDLDTDVILGGASVSRLFPLGDRDSAPPGITGQVTLQGLRLHTEGFESRSDLRTTLRITYQNRVPYINEELNVARWHWRLGAEYTLPNDVSGGASYGLFFRFRQEPGDFFRPDPRKPDSSRVSSLADLLGRTTEYTFSVTRQPNRDVYFGIKVSRFFSF